jgi:capsular exopolysaccharide synthesis family protein
MNDTYIDEGTGSFSYYLKKWYFFVLSVALFLGLAYYYLSELVVPEYGINSTLLIRENEEGIEPKNLTGFADLNLFQPLSKIEDEIEILKSDSLMYRALAGLEQEVQYFRDDRAVYIDDLPLRVRLDTSEKYITYVPATIEFIDDTYYRLVEEEWVERGAERYQIGARVERPYGTFRVELVDSTVNASDLTPVTFEFRTIRELQREFSESFGVSQVNLASSVVTMGLIDVIPQRGVDVMDRIIAGYQVDAVEEKNRMALNTLELIDERLTLLTDELGQVEANVEAYKRNNELIDVTANAERYLERANEYQEELGDYELRLDILNSIERYIRQPADNFTSVPSSLTIQDPTLTALVARYNDLQLQRQQLLENSTASNPLVVDLTRQLTTLRGNILENIANVKEGLTIVRDRLEENSQRFEAQVRRVPSIERDLLEIKREQSIKNSLYLYLLQKREESALSLATGVPALRVLSNPTVSDEPVNEKDTLVYFAALLAGLFVPFGMLTLRRMFFDRIETPDGLRNLTRAPVIGEISPKSGKKDLIVTADNSSPAAELFRLLVYNLEFAHPKHNQVILITSGKSGEGKTFVAANVGASLALNGKRVVVISMDLRNPRTLFAPQAQRDIGATDFIENREGTRLDELATPSQEVDNLYFIGSGNLPANPAQMMRRERVADLIAGLRERYDHVVIDSAPIGLVSDAFALSKLVDVTLYVVRAKYTRPAEIRTINDINENGKLPRPVIVLNDYKNEVMAYGYGRYTK